MIDRIPWRAPFFVWVPLALAAKRVEAPLDPARFLLSLLGLGLLLEKLMARK